MECATIRLRPVMIRLSGVRMTHFDLRTQYEGSAFHEMYLVAESPLSSSLGHSWAQISHGNCILSGTQKQ